MEQPKDKRYKKISAERKTYEIHLRLSKNDYLNIRAGADINGMKLTEYVRNKALSDYYCKINTDFELYLTLGKAVEVLTRTGNYMVKVISLCERNEDYKKAVDIKDVLELEKQSVNHLKKTIIEYKKRLKDLAAVNTE